MALLDDVVQVFALSNLDFLPFGETFIDGFQASFVCPALVDINLFWSSIGAVLFDEERFGGLCIPSF